jgi:hypothetical protein
MNRPSLTRALEEHVELANEDSDPLVNEAVID